MADGRARTAGPDPGRVQCLADLARELDLLRARAAGGSRKQRVSVAELAGKVSEPRSTVHAYVSGTHLPASDVLDRIVIALGATPIERRAWSEAWFRVSASQQAERAARVRQPPSRQLPADVENFVGRAAELAALDRLLATVGGSAMPIAAIVGAGGIGKSALAVRWARRAAARFPAGQFWLDLRGFDPNEPVDPADALARFLRALGVPGTGVPAGTEDRAALFRSLLDGRRMLVVLDNARDSEHVRLMLPGSPSCLVVVTSRDRLTGLVARHGAHRVELDVLPEPDAAILLGCLIGPRVDADPATTTALALRCARLPLALRIAAEHAAGRPAMPLRDLITELADEHRLLDLLDADGDPRTAVRAVFSWSYRNLDAPTARAFRLLGLHPGPHFDAYATAALTGDTVGSARRTLGRLAAAHLVQQVAADRYTMHDLLRAWAAEQAAADPDAERMAATSRLFDGYLATAAAAMDVLYPHETCRRPQVPRSGAAPLTGERHARGWLETERANLVAMLRFAAWCPRQVVALTGILWRHLDTSAHYTDALRLAEHAVAAAEELGDHAGQANALTNLSVQRSRLNQFDSAAALLNRAGQLYDAVGDLIGKGRAVSNLGIVHAKSGRYDQARRLYQEALALFREASDELGLAYALSNLGTVHEMTGHHEQAAEVHQQVIELHRRSGNRAGEGRALSNLGAVYELTGRHQDAMTIYQHSLELATAVGDRAGRAHVLTRLGMTANVLGLAERAAAFHLEALEAARATGHRGMQACALNGLGETWLAQGHPQRSIAAHREALQHAESIDDRAERARAHFGLGRAHDDLSEPDLARDHWRQALVDFEHLGLPESAEVRRLLG
jgi:tetratricopeptide (TPR) repeat protein